MNLPRASIDECFDECFDERSRIPEERLAAHCTRCRHNTSNLGKKLHGIAKP